MAIAPSVVDSGDGNTEETGLAIANTDGFRHHHSDRAARQPII